MRSASLDLGINRRLRGRQGNKRVEKSRELPSNHERRSEIYAKALNLFMDRGYSGTSMSMIARSLKMSKANLYYYCSSKEDLFYKIHLDYLQNNFIPIVEKAEPLPDPKARIDVVLRGLALLNTSDRAVRVLIPDILKLNRDHHNEIVMIWRRAYDIVEKSIEELQSSGKARHSKGAFQTFLAFGMTNWIAYWFDYGRRSHGAELAETLVDTFFHGLLNPEPE